MAATEYTYLVSEDFPNGKVAPDRLAQEVRESAIVVALDYIEVDGNDCHIWFKDELSSADQTVLGGVVAVHSGEPLDEGDPKSPTGVPYIEQLAREGNSVVIVSHNWPDQCTWYGQSVPVTAETLTDSGDGLKFTSTHDHWIDLHHGRLYGEDKIKRFRRRWSRYDDHLVGYCMG